MGHIFYLMGKSASGKDQIHRTLLSEKELNLKEVVLYTTRPMRAGEENGREYHFITEEKVKELEKTGKIIEQRCYETVHGPWRYLTVDDGQILLEKNDYLMIGTLESYLGMKKYFGSQALIPLYIYVEDGIRLERALKRERMQSNPRYAEMCRRFLADEADFSRDKLQEAGINDGYENLDFSECIGNLRKVIRGK